MTDSIRRIGATYRLQVRDIGFGGATKLVPYLSLLGIETVYLSPIFTARPGSTHGYDIVDPVEIDPALGGAAGFELLLSALDEVGMNVLLDIVPNHLAIDPANRYFEATLRNGPSSSDGETFDVDWDDAGGKIVLTVLGRPLADALENGEVNLAPGGDAIVTPGRRYPLAHPVEVARDAGQRDARSVLDEQHYRLAYWRLRTSELNYRRFFEIDELIALRQEDPSVYAVTHRLVLELASDLRVAGLRVDHVDGLSDPAGYLRRLVCDLSAQHGGRPSVLVEKILGHDEVLPSWPVEGTTGYEFARLVTGLFVDADGAAILAEEYRVRTGDARTFSERQWDAKRRALLELFPAQLERTARPFVEVIATSLPGSDVARDDLIEAIRELICALQIYRTYGVGSTPLARSDVAAVHRALDRVRTRAEPEVVRAATLVTEALTGVVGSTHPLYPDARRRFEQLATAVMAKGSEDTALFDPGTPLVAAEVGATPDAPAVAVEAFHRTMSDRLRRSAGLNATSTHDTKRSEEVRARLAVLTDEPSEWLLNLDRWRRAHERDRASCDVADELYLYETIVGLATPGRATTSAFRRRVVDHVTKAAREAKRRTSWMNPNHAYERDLRHLAESVLSPANSAFHRDLERVLGRLIEPAKMNVLAMTVLKIASPGVPDLYQGTEAGIASVTDPDNRRPVPFVALERSLIRSRRARQEPRATPAPTQAAPDPRKLLITSVCLDARRVDPELFDLGRYVPLHVHGEQADHVVAFARVRATRAAIAIVTRQGAKLPVANGRVTPRSWGDTGIEIPESLLGEYTDVCAAMGLTLTSELSVAHVLGALPVALLIRGGPEPTGATSALT